MENETEVTPHAEDFGMLQASLKSWLDQSSKLVGDPEITPAKEDPAPTETPPSEPEPVKVKAKKPKPVSEERIQQIIQEKLSQSRPPESTPSPGPSLPEVPAWAKGDPIVGDLEFLSSGAEGERYAKLRGDYVTHVEKRNAYLQKLSEDGGELSDYESEIGEWDRKNPMPLDLSEIKVEARIERRLRKEREELERIKQDVERAKLLPAVNRQIEAEVGKLHSLELGEIKAGDGVPEWAEKAVAEGLDALKDDYKFEHDTLTEAIESTEKMVAHFIRVASGVESFDPNRRLDQDVMDAFQGIEHSLIQVKKGKTGDKKLITRAELAAMSAKGRVDLSQYAFIEDADILRGFRFRALQSAILKVKREEERLEALGYARKPKVTQRQQDREPATRAPAPIPANVKTPAKPPSEDAKFFESLKSFLVVSPK